MSRPEVHFPTPRAAGSTTTLTSMFAPRYLVGNVPNGDPAAAQAAPFQYIPDPGDGSGIAAALAAAAASPGLIEVRAGTYDFNAGAVTGPLLIPAGTTLHGAGLSTLIKARSDGGDQGVFTLDQRSSLQAMQVVADRPGVPTGGHTAVVSIAGDDVLVTGVLVSANPNPGDALQAALQVQPAARSRVLGNRVALLGSNGGAACDLSGTETVLSGNNVTAVGGDPCLRESANNNYLAGNVLNAGGNPQVVNTGVNNTTAPNVLV